MRIVETVVSINETRKLRMVDKIVDGCGGSVADKTIAVLGLTFKPNTDDIRDSASLDVIGGLQEMGAVVRVFDPQGMAEGRKTLDDVTWCADAYDAADGADALAILTEWNEFRALDFTRLGKLLRAKVLVDLRNIYNPAEIARAGFDYIGVGRAPVRRDS